MSYMAGLPDWLRGKLAEGDLTYEKLGEKVGVRHSSISQWVNGKHLPEPKQLLRLAEVFNENPFMLFNLAYGLPLPGGEGREIRPLEAEIERLLETLDDDALALLRDQIIHVILPRFRRKEKDEAKNH